MLGITIEGNKVYIPEDTTIVLEQHNNALDIENLTADLIWTFDLPAESNAMIFGCAHYVNVSNYKKYKCLITFDGIPLAAGELYIQQATDEKTLSCGVVVDGLGGDFGKRKLPENEYGDDVVISSVDVPLDQYRTNWMRFLVGAANDSESPYKFFTFCCEKFYKDNEDYGFHQGKESPLQNTFPQKSKFWIGFVNRLFMRPPMTPLQRVPYYTAINQPDNGSYQGLRLFNSFSNTGDKINGYTFTPALRLDWVVRKVFASAGMEVIGDFLLNENVKKLYLQSMNAMDADIIQQFGEDEYLYLTGGAVGKNVATTAQKILDVGVDEVGYTGFRKSTNTTFNFRLNLNIEGLQRNVTETPRTGEPWQFSDESFFLMVQSKAQAEAASYPNIRCIGSSSATVKQHRYGVRPGVGNLQESAGISLIAGIMAIVMEDNGKCILWSNSGVRVDNVDFLYGCAMNNATMIQLTSSKGDTTPASYIDQETGSDVTGNYIPSIFNSGASQNEEYVVQLVKFKIYTVKHHDFDYSIISEWPNTFDVGDGIETGGTIGLQRTSTTIENAPILVQKFGQIEKLEFEEVVEKSQLSNTNTLTNVFTDVLKWKDHVPSVSNADFIKGVCQFFGLNIYVNAFSHQVQLSFFKDLAVAKCLDLTDYIISKERLTYEPKEIDVKIASCLPSKSSSSDFTLQDIVSKQELLPPRNNKKKNVFVANENAKRYSTYDDDDERFEWKQGGGNDKALTVGGESDEKESVESVIMVPNMRVIDEQGCPKYMCDVPIQGNSRLFDEDYTGEFQMILMQYRGKRLVQLITSGVGQYQAYIEDANPTFYNEDGTIDDSAINLTATGERSVGEMWQKPLYEFLAKSEKYRFVALLPTHKFLELHRLLQPQDCTPVNQVRWLMIDNRKYLPTKISYEFQKGKVYTTIECSRQHIEV